MENKHFEIVKIRDVNEPILGRILHGDVLIQEIAGGKCSTFGNGLKFYSVLFPEPALAVKPYLNRPFGYASSPETENILFATKKDGEGEKCCGITFNKDVDKNGQHKSKVLQKCPYLPRKAPEKAGTNIAAPKRCTEEEYRNMTSLEKFSEAVYRVKKSIQKRVHRGEDVSWPYSEVVCGVKTEAFTPRAIIINLDNPQSFKDTKTLRSVYLYKDENPGVPIYTYYWRDKPGKTSNITEVEMYLKHTMQNLIHYGDEHTYELFVDLKKEKGEPDQSRSAKKTTLNHDDRNTKRSERKKREECRKRRQR